MVKNYFVHNHILISNNCIQFAANFFSWPKWGKKGREEACGSIKSHFQGYVVKLLLSEDTHRAFRYNYRNRCEIPFNWNGLALKNICVWINENVTPAQDDQWSVPEIDNKVLQSRDENGSKTHMYKWIVV